jgi:hypothetical protein
LNKDKDKSKLLDKIQERFEKAVTAYSENYEYQVTIQNIPKIGPILDLVIKDLSSKVAFRRFVETHVGLFEQYTYLRFSY